MLKQKDWETLLNKLQANVTIIPADPETTNRGKLRKFLTKWCLDSVKVQEVEGEKWEDASEKLKERMQVLEPEKFEKMVKENGLKSWKQSIDYVTRYVVLNDLEEKDEE